MTYSKLKQDIEKIIDESLNEGCTPRQLKRRINKRLKESITNYFSFLRNFYNENLVINSKRFFGWDWEKNK